MISINITLVKSPISLTQILITFKYLVYKKLDTISYTKPNKRLKIRTYGIIFLSLALESKKFKEDLLIFLQNDFLKDYREERPDKIKLYVDICDKILKKLVESSEQTDPNLLKSFKE